MSDIAPAAPPAAPAPAAAPPAPPAPAPAPAAPAGEDAWETTDPADFASWPDPAKDYVQRLRNEAKTRREQLTALKPYQDTFSTLHEQDAAFFRDFISALQTRDPAKIEPFAGPLRDLLDTLTPAQQKAVAAAAEQAADPTFDPYDVNAIDKRLESKLDERLAAERAERAQADQQRDLERQTQEWVVKMADKAKELAGTHKIADFGDPTSDIGRLLYVVAHNKFASESDSMKRLELAAQSIEETLGSSAQALLKAKTADAAPSPAPADAGGPTAAKKPGDLTAASKSARERIDKIFAGEVGT